MRTRHPDFAHEQRVIEHAHDCHQREIDHQRDVIAGRTNAGADKFAQAKIREKAIDKLDRLEGVDTRRLVVGRLDFADEGRKGIYVGPVTVMDGNHVAVVDFTRDIARGFWRADERDPMGLTRRRRFDVNGRELLDISDEVFAALREAALEDTEPSRVVLDQVAAELEQAREPHMRQIVATIVADQYRMIEAPKDGLFVIQGGPGTGKTAVALHRAVFLIRRNEDLGKVLVVGPNAAFMAYIGHVLPGLGERDVDQMPVDRLASTGDVARASGDDDRPVAALKGSADMAEIIRRAVVARIRPTDEDLLVRAQSVSAPFSASLANEILDAERAAERPYMEGRRRFVEAMRAQAEDLLQSRLSRFTRIRGIDRGRVRVEITADREWSNAVERMWPTAAAAGVIHDLLTTEQRLRQSSEGLLRDSEVQRLLRRGVRAVAVHPFTRADLPLIDEAHEILQGSEAPYGYVIVDEAQDLTPMELRMVARRSRTGDMTLVGDIAQTTGPCRYGAWEEIVAHLPRAGGVREDELTVGYRVPSSIMQLANLLLPRIAPTLTPTEPVREGRFEPEFERVAPEEVPETVAVAVGDLGDEERSIGVIVPSSLLRDVRGALALTGIRVGDISTDQLENRVTLLTGDEAKGLEFDRVVVVEPMAIVTESAAGWNELYVALTRATQQLVIVHSKELPAPLPGGVEPELPPERVQPREPDVAGEEVAADVDLDFDLDLDLVGDSEADADLHADVDLDTHTDTDTYTEVPLAPITEALMVDAELTAVNAETPSDSDPVAVSEPREEVVDGGRPEEDKRQDDPRRRDGGGGPAGGRQRLPATSTVRLSGDFSEALVLANAVTGDRRRAGTAIPFLSHLLGAAALVLEDGGTETEAICALLHDAVEDGPPGTEETIRRRFGSEVADIVLECTDPTEGSFRERKLEHIRRLEAGSRSARRVALAEKLDNARAIVRDLERYGNDTWKAMAVEKEELIWYLWALVALFSRAFPSVLASELERAVTRIEELAAS